MKNHGILLNGMLENMSPFTETYMTGIVPSKYETFVSIKRPSGPHRIATFLREKDWDIEVLDYVPAFSMEEFQQFIRSRVTSETKFLGMGFLFWLKDYMGTLNKKFNWFKKEYPDIPIIVGCKNQSIIHWLDADYHVNGYGEEGLWQLLLKLTGKESNVHLREFDFMGTKRTVVDCDIHHPAFPCKDLQVKYEERDYIEPDEILTIETTRGCRFRCKFCAFNVLGVKGDYSRDMDNLKEELLRNYQLWGTTNYNVADETFNESTDRLKRIRDVVKTLPFQPHFFGFVRGDLLVAREDDWKYMAEIGHWGHFYGIETIHPEAGKYVGKGMPVEKLKDGLLRIKDEFPKYSPNGYYRMQINILAGLPHESLEEFENNYWWLKNTFPAQTMSASSLYIANDNGKEINTAQSVFDKTWRDDGWFEETNDEEIGANIDDLLGPAHIKKSIWAKYKQGLALNWKSSLASWWDCHLLMSKLLIEDVKNNDNSPSIWYFHRWLTGQNDKFTFEDMHKPVRDTSYFNDTLYESHLVHINNYKHKKLSL